MRTLLSALWIRNGIIAPKETAVSVAALIRYVAVHLCMRLFVSYRQTLVFLVENRSTLGNQANFPHIGHLILALPVQEGM